MYYLFVNELSMKAKDPEKNLADMIHVELGVASSGQTQLTMFSILLEHYPWIIKM
jgi:hypothetical protein